MTTTMYAKLHAARWTQLKFTIRDNMVCADDYNFPGKTLAWVDLYSATSSRVWEMVVTLYEPGSTKYNAKDGKNQESLTARMVTEPIKKIVLTRFAWTEK